MKKHHITKLNRAISTLSRRRMLAALGLGTGAAMFGQALSPSLARADFDPDTAPILISCYFNGGFDQLLAFDPRNNDNYADENSGIYPGYQLHADGDVLQTLNDYSGGIVRPSGCQVDFGPAARKLAETHYDKLCVLRGMDMGTLTHEVGMRYFLTGKFPRGLSASGSALPTVMVDQVGTHAPIPNLVMGMESYNEGLSPAASGLRLNELDDLASVLQALEPDLSLDDNARDLIDDYVAALDCHGQRLDADGQVSNYLANRSKAEALASGELFQYFDFFKPANQLSTDVKALLDYFGVQPGNQRDLQSAKAQAALAAQAAVKGVSQAISIQLATGIDHHDDTYQDDHATAVREGLDALSQLISYLEEAGVWDRCILVAWSEFARTPRINGRGGRDHHLASSCLVAGKGIAGNRVIGATEDETFGTRGVDLDTGEAVSEGGVVLRPPDVHATMLKAIGVNYEHLSNNDPQIIDAMLA